MKYVKYTPWRSIKNGSRDIREINYAKSKNNDVFVFSNDNNTSIAQSYVAAGVGVISSNVVELNDRMTKIEKLCVMIRNYLSLVPKTLKLEADVLSCHDLNSLLAAYISTRFTRKKPLLVYDSHEYELGRNKKRSNLKKRIIKGIEGFLIKKCILTIVVNDSIADKLVEVYSMKRRPVVIRSTPEKWNLDQQIVKKTKTRICSRMGISEDCFITMYHGNLFENRGIEKHLEAIKRIPDTAAVFMGAVSDEYLSELKAIAAGLGISDRVLFLDAVRQADIWKYVGGADVSIIAIPASCESYYYMLPNKFLESIQSGTPVIASDFPEIRRIVQKYDIGLLCDPDEVNDIASKIIELKNNRGRCMQLKENILKAKEDLCWENEQIRLQTVFDIIEKEKICQS